MAIAASTSINAFHIIGGCLAAWAVLLTGVGVLRPDFPPKGLEKVIIAVSVILVVGAISSAIAVSGESKPKSTEQAGAKQKAGPEGTGGTGATPAPGTGNTGGQHAQKPPSPGAAQNLQLSADPSGALKFDKTSLSATAGTVRLVLSNPAPVPHNISIQGPGVTKQGPTVSQGGNSQVAANLKPGTYTYYCAVPGHRQAGMQGTLTIK